MPQSIRLIIINFQSILNQQEDNQFREWINRHIDYLSQIFYNSTWQVLNIGKIILANPEINLFNKGTFLENLICSGCCSKLKEQVDLQIVIKKGHQNIIVPQKTKLINGIANLNLHYQFFVSQDNPVFQIYVMILIGSSKKLAGMCQINLAQWQENANHSTISHLLKSPDVNAKIDYDFMYLSTDIKISNKKLLSLGQLESIKKSIFMKEMEDKNLKLVSENDRLNKQIVAVQKQKTQLLNYQEMMTEQFEKSSEDFEKKLREKSIQLQSSQNNFNVMKQKIQRIEQIINKYGQSTLKQKMENILNSKT